MKILQEKASIDWNNYLTPEEVQKFLSKDDKVESAEEIIYNTKGNFYNKYFKDFKEQGWTKRELTQDLSQFFYNGHLIKEEYNFDDYNKRIEEYKNKQLQDFINKLRTNFPKCKVSEPIHSKYSGDRIKITHKNLIITIILMELLETESGQPEYAISYDGHQNYIGVADDVIQFIKNYIEQDYMLTENNKLQESILLYHGSPNTNLKELSIGENKTTGNEYGTGIYLTTNYDEALQYAGNNGKVYTVELDDTNLYNLKDKLTNNMKQIITKDLINNDRIKNQIVSYNRKQYKVTNNQEGKEFYLNKLNEYNKLDGVFMANIPKVNKIDNNIIITYTDYNNINGAIDKLTGEQLQHILTGDIDPDIFTLLIIKSGFDGIITHNGNWYVLYKNANKSKIIEQKLTEDFNSNKYILKGNKDEQIFDVASSNSKEQLNQISQDIQPGNPDVKFWIEDNKNIRHLLENNKLEEASRNELLAKTKMQTLSRYKRADEYRGFTLTDVDTDHLLTTDTLPVTCKVGKYWDTIELQDILYWIQYEAEKNKNNQVNNHAIRDAILKAVDAMDIKVNCTCADSQYRFNYFLTKIGAKYGIPENRPAKITNPNDYGALCKHLTAILSNKKWMQQVAAPVMDWFDTHIDDVNRWLRVKPGEELTLPDELARKNAKKGFYAKLMDKIEDENNEE